MDAMALRHKRELWRHLPFAWLLQLPRNIFFIFIMWAGGTTSAPYIVVWTKFTIRKGSSVEFKCHEKRRVSPTHEEFKYFKRLAVAHGCNLTNTNKYNIRTTGSTVMLMPSPPIHEMNSFMHWFWFHEFLVPQRNSHLIFAEARAHRA